MSAYTKRKYVAQEVESLFELPEGKQIAKILRGQGNNLHLVETQDGEQFLASMPTKFRKYVWVKRGESVYKTTLSLIRLITTNPSNHDDVSFCEGDFVVIEPIEEGVKVKAEIFQVILRNQIKMFKKDGTW
jgi:probable RNA-binding protein EIF1AD